MRYLRHHFLTVDHGDHRDKVSIGDRFENSFIRISEKPLKVLKLSRLGIAKVDAI